MGNEEGEGGNSSGKGGEGRDGDFRAMNSGEIAPGRNWSIARCGREIKEKKSKE
jgi:hypothetical protein